MTTSGRVAALLVVVALTGCGVVTPPRAAPQTPTTLLPSLPSTRCTTDLADMFTTDPVSLTGGAPDPVAAAEAFIRRGSIWESPEHGWRVVEAGTTSTTVTAEDIFLEATEGPDGTWQVHSGYRCI